MKKFKPTRTIFVDIDGTILRNGILNQTLVDWCRRLSGDGYTFILWSARGEFYARKVAERFGIADIFRFIISKPENIIDDQGWNWIKYVRIIRELWTR